MTTNTLSGTSARLNDPARPSAHGEEQCGNHVREMGERDPRTLTRAKLCLVLRERATVSVPFAGACCGLSRSAAYGAARDGSLRTLKLGHSLRVPTSWLEKQLALGSEEHVGAVSGGEVEAR